MSRLIEFPTEGEDVILVEVEEATRPDELLRTASDETAPVRAAKKFEEALKPVNCIARKIIEDLDSLTRAPDQAEVEFGLNLNGGRGGFRGEGRLRGPLQDQAHVEEICIRVRLRCRVSVIPCASPYNSSNFLTIDTRLANGHQISLLIRAKRRSDDYLRIKVVHSLERCLGATMGRLGAEMRLPSKSNRNEASLYPSPRRSHGVLTEAEHFYASLWRFSPSPLV